MCTSLNVYITWTKRELATQTLEIIFLEFFFHLSKSDNLSRFLVNKTKMVIAHIETKLA